MARPHHFAIYIYKKPPQQSIRLLEDVDGFRQHIIAPPMDFLDLEKDSFIEIFNILLSCLIK